MSLVFGGMSSLNANAYKMSFVLYNWNVMTIYKIAVSQFRTHVKSHANPIVNNYFFVDLLCIHFLSEKRECIPFFLSTFSRVFVLLVLCHLSLTQPFVYAFVIPIALYRYNGVISVDEFPNIWFFSLSL